MADGRLIVEIYEYPENSPEIPTFAFYPCNLQSCIKRSNKSTLKEIIENGFDDLNKKERNIEKKQEALEKLEEASFGKIVITYHPRSNNSDPYIELNNVIPVSLAYADARRAQQNNNDIILIGRYKLTEGNETTVLKDAQRLTLIYSNFEDLSSGNEDEKDCESEDRKEICLNLTFLEE